MTDPLDTLRPEVQKALDDLSYFLTGTHNHNDFYIIRAELLRLDKINRILEIKNAGTLANNLCPDHRDKQTSRPCLACLLEKSESELAALKARILPGAAKVEIADTDDPDGNPYGWVGGTLLSHNLIGKRVRLLVVEE